MNIFLKKKSVRKFAEEIRNQNMKAESSYYKEISAWNVKVKVKYFLTHAKITKTENGLETIAKKLNGKKDGWGVLKNS